MSNPLLDNFGLSPMFINKKLPVPKEHFMSPALKQACPNNAACWSTSKAWRGNGLPLPKSISAMNPADGFTSGSILRGTSNNASKSSSHSNRFISNKSVREAVDGSVTCNLPLVSDQSAQVSVVPNFSLPACACWRISGWFSKTHLSLGAEK